MLTHRAPGREEGDPDREQIQDDLAAAAHAAAGLSDSAEILARANRATRALARRLGEDPDRLRRCVHACRHQAERTTDSHAQALWHRAERLSWNALTLVEALRANPAPDH
jgi:hypothetical protein